MTGHGGAGVVMGKLGAEVWATDLEPNLPLLRDNFAANGKKCWSYCLLLHCCPFVPLSAFLTGAHEQPATQFLQTVEPVRAGKDNTCQSQ